MKLAIYRGELVEVLPNGLVFTLLDGQQIDVDTTELRYADNRGKGTSQCG